MKKVCIGMFLHNEEKYLTQALESLLAQTYQDFRLIVLDDCSTDSTEEIVRRYAEQDDRITFVKNPSRMGYAANYRITFQLAGAVDYFAWAAGHDVYHPRWLEALVRALDEYPDAVVAYSQTVRIDGKNQVLAGPSPVLDTTGLGLRERLRVVGSLRKGFGDMVYGLFRADALRKAGVMRPVLLLDRLLLTELAMAGTFKEVPEALWSRRYPNPLGLSKFDVARQRTIAFPATGAPAYTRLPWWVVHAALLAWNLALRPSQPSSSYRRWLGLCLAARVLRTRARIDLIEKPLWRWRKRLTRFGARLRGGPLAQRCRTALRCALPGPLRRAGRWFLNRLSWAAKLLTTRTRAQLLARSLDGLDSAGRLQLVAGQVGALAEADRADLAARCLEQVGGELVVPVVGHRAGRFSDVDLSNLQLALEQARLGACEREAILFRGPAATRPGPAALLREGDVPLLIGPWLSEVGFELLYWLPFLRRYLGRHGVSPERVVALSRGGVAGWYAGIAGRYIDIFDLISPEEYVAGNRERIVEQKGQKQLALSSFDERLIALVAGRLGLKALAVVHPALMYRFFLGAWGGYDARGRLQRWCGGEPLPGSWPRTAGLPFEDYVAVKFYHSSCFPETPENTRLVRRLVAELARRTNVVLLNTGLRIDDHADPACGGPPNVFDATPLMAPNTNLAVQTSVVAHARALYCTYGGFSYLAPLLGVPAVSLYAALPDFTCSHLEQAFRVFNADRPAAITAVSTSALGLLSAGHEVAAPPPAARAA